MASEKIAAAVIALMFVSSCKQHVGETASNEDTRIEWRRLADNSFGWSSDDENSVNAERCWEAGKRFECIRLWRLHPADMQIDANPITLATSFFRDSLQRTDVDPEHGYSCQIMIDGATEQLSLANGATIRNTISSMGTTAGSFWSPEFVRRFIAQNDPTTGFLYFRCEAIQELLRSGNESAILTTAISSPDLHFTTASIQSG